MSSVPQHNFQDEYIHMHNLTSTPLPPVIDNFNLKTNNLESQIQTEQIDYQSNDFKKIESDILKLDHRYYKIQQQYSLSHEYLQLQDSIKETNNEILEDNNYYDIVLHESSEKEKLFYRRHFKWLITGVTVCILFLIFFLSGIILTKYALIEKNINGFQAEKEFCNEFTANSANQLSCQHSFVRNMTISAFSAYKKYAWGAPELDAVNLEPYTNPKIGNYFGLTVVDAMSTLWVMELNEEWAAGKEWISANLNFANLDKVVRVREAFLDYLGGLLSAYALSGDVLFLEKAKEVYKALTPAFNEATGMLAYKFNPKQKISFGNETSVLKAHGHKLENDNFIAWVGFQQPEFIFIGNLTGDRVMEERLSKNRVLIETAKLPNGQYTG